MEWIKLEWELLPSSEEDIFTAKKLEFSGLQRGFFLDFISRPSRHRKAAPVASQA